MTDDCIAQARLYHVASEGGLVSAVAGGDGVEGVEGVEDVKGVELLRSRAEQHRGERQRWTGWPQFGVQALVIC